MSLLVSFFSIDEKKSTLGDSRTPKNRYAWAKQKSRLILFCLNSTRHYTIASKHRAQAGPFAINVHWTFPLRSVLFGCLPFRIFWIFTKNKSMSKVAFLSSKFSTPLEHRKLIKFVTKKSTSICYWQILKTS